MVDWQSPAELQVDAAAFSNLMHVLFGLYIWEFVTSLCFEWQFISGKKKFKWPLTFYFAGRYCLLFAFIGIIIALDVRTEIDCQALYTFNQVIGNAVVGLASINLSIRTMAVWSQSRYIMAFLVLVILGHWSILLHGILLKAARIQGTCIITYTDNKTLAMGFIYSMCFDFIVLCMTGWKLALPSGGRSTLTKLIFGDGLIYFLIAFLSNLVATIFMLLNLNAVMSVIANVPAAVASTIVASRAVRRLTNFTTGKAEFLTHMPFRTPTAIIPEHHISMKKGESVHIQMETYVERSDVGYDPSGRIVQGDDYDPEAQATDDEFKKPPY